MNSISRLVIVSALALGVSKNSFALPGVPAGIPIPAVPEMPKVKCGVDAPPYIVLAPGSNIITSLTVTLNNSQAQLYRASLCTMAAQRDLMVAMNQKEMAESLSKKVKNLSGTSINAEKQAELLASAADPSLTEALTEAAKSLGDASEDQKNSIREADMKRMAAGMALASLAVDGGRLVMDIASLVQKIQSGDASVLADMQSANLSVELIKLWPGQIKDIVAAAGEFGKAAKNTDKAIKEVYKVVKMDPPKAADVKAFLSAAGDE